MPVSLSFRSWSILALLLGAGCPLLLFLFWGAPVGAAQRTQSLPPVWAWIGVIAALALIAWVAVRYLCDPLRAVSRAAVRVARGEAVETFRPTRVSEVNVMSSALLSLNHEARSVRAQLEESVEHHNADLGRERGILAATLNSMPDAVVAISVENGTILHANDRATDLFSRLGSLTGLNSELLSKEVRGWFEEPGEWTSWWKMKKVASLDFARRFEINHETIRQLEVIGSTIRNADNNDSTPALRTWIFRDLTGATARASKRSQQAKIQAMGRFSEEVANNFNNALSAIQGSLDLVRLQVTDQEDPSDALSIANEACLRGGKVVDQLLSLSTRPKIDVGPVSMAEVVQGTVLLVKSTRKTEVRIDFEPSETLPPVEGDAANLYHVLLALVMNASQAMDGSGTIQIRAAQREVGSRHGQTPGSYYRLTIEDSGHGMTAEVQAQMFEPFFTTRKGARGGLGLGLYRAFGIVEAHRGWIECKSSPGKGAKFEIFLPISYASLSATQRPGRPFPRVLTDPVAERTSSRILVVDDESVIRCTAREILTRRGHEMIEAEDGVEALEVLSAEGGDASVDLVLLDLTMPRMGGAEALAEIKRQWPELPVLIWSGYAADVEWKEDDEPKPEGFLQKPVNAATLLAKIETVLEEAEQTAA